MSTGRRAAVFAAVLAAVLATAGDCGDGQNAAVPDCPGNEVPQQNSAGQWSCVPPGGGQ